MAVPPSSPNEPESVALATTAPGTLAAPPQQQYLAPVQPPMYPPPPAQVAAAAAEPESIISIADLVGYLRRFWKVGALIGLPLAALAFVQLGMGKKLYEAEAQLLLRIQDTNVFNFNELSRSAVGELSAPLLINNHRAEMTSRSYMEFFHDSIPVARRMAYLEEDLNQVSWIQPFKDWVKETLGLAKPKRPPNLQEMFIKKISKATRVEPLKESHILRVQIRGHDKDEVADFANDYVSIYIDYVSQQELKGTRSASAFLQNKAEELRTRLRDSEAELASYRQQAGVLKSGNGMNNSSGEKLRLLTQAMADAEVNLTKARYQLETIQGAQNTEEDLLRVKVIADNPQVDAKRTEISQLQAQLTPLLEFCGPRHPKVMGLNNDIAKRRAELSDLISAVVTMVAREVETLTGQLTDFRSQVAAERGDVIALGDKEIQEKMLIDQVEMDRQMYQNIVMRMNQADVTSEFTDNGVLRIADKATPPEKPIQPKKTIAAIAAMMVFGVCLFGVPIGWGLTDDHVLKAIREEGAEPQGSGSEAASGFAAAPTAPAAAPPPPPAASSAQELPTTAAPMTLNQGGRPTMLAEFPLLTAQGENEALAELLKSEPRGAANALRQLTGVLEKQALYRSGPGGTILITSSEEREGKSLTAAALAATFCHHGRRVLVIDCHTSMPGLHRFFPHSERNSYTASSLEELRYGDAGLYVLPAHDLPSHETNDLLDGYRAWIDRAKTDVDWIILDGPPVLKNFTDVAPLAPLATDVVVVHDPVKTGAAKLRAAMTLLQPMMSSSAMRGLIENRIQRKS